MVRFSHQIIMYHLQEIDATLSESEKIFSPQCPLVEIFEPVLPMSDAFNNRFVLHWARNELK